MAQIRMITDFPRLPLESRIDLTYRCNNACRHCWLLEPDDDAERAREMSTEEWRTVVDQGRALGTREWLISGGEPMLREDFSEVFDYVTAKATRYSLNTNGTLITPSIAQLLRRKGNKMVAVYGATAEVYDRVTRNPGGFAALLQGLAYLKEAGAGFTVQLIPMRENWQQWELMLRFAESWSAHERVGAPWLFKTASGHEGRNAEIERQRLDPADIVALDPPGVADGSYGAVPACGTGDDRLYAACVESRRGFHVDAYGGLSLCASVKDPRLRYDLHTGESVERVVTEPQPAPRGILPGAVQRAWEEFIPSLANAVHGGREYLEGCAQCELRADCNWCDVYGYLEHGRHGAKVEHLCAVTRASRDHKAEVLHDHRRYFTVAGITVQLDSDLPFAEDTLETKFAGFRVSGPGEDTVRLHHRFGLPEQDGADGAEEVYRRSPWAIYRRKESWLYHGISPVPDEDPTLDVVAVFNADHTNGEIYNDDVRRGRWCEGRLEALTMFASDQIVLARLLADRDACLLHSSALIIDGQGLVFVGHSDAGKSTIALLLRDALGDRAAILCDDRNVVRFWPQGFSGGPPGFYVHGTWSHGDVPDVSPAGAPLRGIFFLEQSQRNEIVSLSDRLTAFKELLATLVKPLATADWWNKEIDVLERIVCQVPCHTLRFDRSGAIVADLERLARGTDPLTQRRAPC